VVSAFFIWGRKITWLSSKVTFAVLLVFLVITSLLLGKLIYKVNNTPKAAEEITNSKSLQDDQEILIQDTENYKKKTTIVIGTTANFYPWIYKTNKNVAGFNAEVLKKAVNLMAKKVSFKMYPSTAALFNALDKKEIDVIADLSPVYNTEGSKYAYSLKITNPPFVFIAKKSLTKKLANNKDLQKLASIIQGKTVAIPNSQFFKDHMAEFIGDSSEVIPVNSYNDLVLGVAKGKYQVGFTEYFSFLQYLKAHPKSNIGIFHPLINNHLNEGLAFVINSKDVELKKQLDIALSLLKRRGVISNLSVKYFKEDVTL